MPGVKSIHTPKFDKMVTAIKRGGSDVNPYAVAMAKLGRNKAVKKSHWKEIGLGATGK